MGLVNKIKEIADGWTSLALGLNSKLARDRAKICDKCPEAIFGTFEDFIDDKIEEVKGMKCAQCGCPLSAKLRSKNSKCDLKKW